MSIGPHDRPLVDLSLTWIGPIYNEDLYVKTIKIKFKIKFDLFRFHVDGLRSLDSTLQHLVPISTRNIRTYESFLRKERIKVPLDSAQTVYLKLYVDAIKPMYFNPDIDFASPTLADPTAVDYSMANYDFQSLLPIKIKIPLSAQDLVEGHDYNIVVVSNPSMGYHAKIVDLTKPRFTPVALATAAAAPAAPAPAAIPKINPPSAPKPKSIPLVILPPAPYAPSSPPLTGVLTAHVNTGSFNLTDEFALFLKISQSVLVDAITHYYTKECVGEIDNFRRKKKLLKNLIALEAEKIDRSKVIDLLEDYDVEALKELDENSKRKFILEAYSELVLLEIVAAFVSMNNKTDNDLQSISRSMHNNLMTHLRTERTTGWSGLFSSFWGV